MTEVTSSSSNLLSGFPLGSVLKNPPAVQETQETWVQSFGWEDPLEEEMANPLQYSCLRNPMDRGASWTIVHGVTKESDTTE